MCLAPTCETINLNVFTTSGGTRGWPIIVDVVILVSISLHHGREMRMNVEGGPWSDQLVAIRFIGVCICQMMMMMDEAHVV